VGGGGALPSALVVRSARAEIGEPGRRAGWGADALFLLRRRGDQRRRHRSRRLQEAGPGPPGPVGWRARSGPTWASSGASLSASSVWLELVGGGGCVEVFGRRLLPCFVLAAVSASSPSSPRLVHQTVAACSRRLASSRFADGSREGGSLPTWGATGDGRGALAARVVRLFTQPSSCSGLTAGDGVCRGFADGGHGGDVPPTRGAVVAGC
jgi:hypothetical protein